MKKIDLSKYKIKQSEDNSKIQSWQDTALKIIKDFDIKNKTEIIINKKGIKQKQVYNYTAIIFRHAKNNMSYLLGKVELCREKFGEYGLKGKGNYLISLFRKSKPWEK